LIWKFPTESNAEAPPKNPGRDVGFMHAVTERIFENNTYGTMSSDGELVFMVNEGDPQQMMRGTPIRNNRVIWGPNGQVVQNAGPTAKNILTALSLREEGKLIWAIGDEEGDLSDLGQAYFLGPPLPLGGQLYALAESKKRISLVALEAKTGQLLWTQPLCDVELDVTQDPFRRISGATPSYADGVLICPTGAGAIVAVDLATRSLLWGKRFTVSNEQQQLMIQRMQMGWNFNGQMVQPVNPGTHWVDGCAVIADGRVYVTPMESDKLHCFSLIDGKDAWPSRNREGGLYIGAVTKDHLILVSESQVQALGVADGKTKWSCALGSNRPSGRGFFSGAYYYLPLSSAEVIKIDLANNGEIKARARSRFGNVPGNLICYQGYVISQGANTVDKFFQLESLRERVTKSLATKPDDREAIAWRGEIALDDGRLEQAMSDLRSAFQVTPEQVSEGEERDAWTAERERIRELLIDALASAFESKQPGRGAYLVEIEKLMESDEERSRYLRLLAMGRHDDGDIPGALEAYLQLADLKTPTQELEDVGGGHSVRRERWIRSRLETLWRLAKPEDRAPVDEAISQRLAKAEQSRENKAEALRTFLTAFGFHPLANQARERLLVEFSESESPLEREQLLLSLERSGDERQRRMAVTRLATLFQTQGRVPEALAYYRRLEREYGDVECLPGLTGKAMVAALSSEDKLARAMQTWNQWPVGAVKEEKQTRGGRQNQASYQQFWPIDIRGDQGPFFAGRQVLYDQQMYQILGRDEYGRESFRLMLNEAGAFRNYGYGYNTNHGVVSGHLLLVNTGYQVLAIDTLRNQAGGRQRVLWHVDLIDPMQLQLQMMTGWGGIEFQAINNPWGQARMGRIKVNNQPASTMSAVIDGGVAILRGRELTFYDVLSGKPQWTRHNLPPGCDIWGDSEVLIVATPDKDDAIVLRTQDGSDFAKRKAPRPDMRWAFFGRNVLTWREKPGRLHQVFLYDVAEGKEIDLGTYPMSSKGTIVVGDSVAIYDTTGRFVVLSLADGSKLLEAKVEPERQLNNVFVQRSADQYLVVTNRPRLARTSRNTNYQPVTYDPYGGTGAGLISGRVYSFDRDTGASLWQTPALVETHGYLHHQPSELPVLVFARHAHDRNQQAKGSILCLDKRTGRAVFQREDGLGQIYNFEASADPEARAVSLATTGANIVLKYTDAPTAPEPTYQAQEPPESNNPLYRTPLGRVLRAFGRAAEQEMPMPADVPNPADEVVEEKAEIKVETREVPAKKE
jgi:outer membrane protein assembly factor BamB